MRTPAQWLDLFTAQDQQYDRPTAEANIKAVQDEAFKAGLSRAMELCQAVGLGHVTDMLRRERDKALAADLADPALKARLKEGVRKRKRLEGQ